MRLNELTATEIVKKIVSGSTTAEEVMHDCLARIHEREGSVRAFVSLDENLAMERARRSDVSGKPGQLRGVPFVIKDIIDTVDFPAGWGSAIYEGRRPRRNASCVELLLTEGAIPVGKSVTTEFACFNPGKTTNPHNPGHTPGGSSSGSAAAVADCMVPLGLGSQTAASLVRPAAFCGVFAYKASHGMIDLEGVMGLAQSLDSLGMLARSVSDLRLSNRALCRVPPQPIWNSDTAPRIALFRGPHWSECSIKARDACTRAMSRLSDSGAEVAEIAFPETYLELAAAHKTVMAFEVATARLFEYNNHRQKLSPKFTELVQDGLSTPVGEYRDALDMRDRAQRQLDTMFTDLDAFLCPAAADEAPSGLDSTGDPLFSRIWTLLKLPAVSIPCAKGENGLPIAVQLVGRRNEDARLLAAADWVANTLADI